MKEKIATVYVCDYCEKDYPTAWGALSHEFDCLRKPNREYHIREMLGDLPLNQLSAEQRAWLKGRDEREEAYIEAGLANMEQKDIKPGGDA